MPAAPSSGCGGADAGSSRRLDEALDGLFGRVIRRSGGVRISFAHTSLAPAPELSWGTGYTSTTKQ
jgi:hypothetical protein